MRDTGIPSFIILFYEMVYRFLWWILTKRFMCDNVNVKLRNKGVSYNSSMERLFFLQK